MVSYVWREGVTNRKEIYRSVLMEFGGLCVSRQASLVLKRHLLPVDNLDTTPQVIKLNTHMCVMILPSAAAIIGALTLPLGYFPDTSRVNPFLRDVNCDGNEMYLLECAVDRESREEGDGDRDGDGDGDGDRDGDGDGDGDGDRDGDDGNRDDGDDSDDDECLPVSMRCDGKLTKHSLPFTASSSSLFP